MVLSSSQDHWIHFVYGVSNLGIIGHPAGRSIDSEI